MADNVLPLKQNTKEQNFQKQNKKEQNSKTKKKNSDFSLKMESF
jgi:hypothetical protein